MDSGPSASLYTSHVTIAGQGFQVIKDRSILAYQDYRSFLRQAFAQRKAEQPLWSYATFARALGLKSAASIHKIVQGQRDPSPTLTARMLRYFAFTPREQSHFLQLVLQQRRGKRAPGPAVLAANAAAEGGFRPLSEGEFAAISGWWFYTIRQMARWPDFQADPAWIQARLAFPLRRSVIRQALMVMQRLNLLDERRGLSFSSDSRRSLALRAFHEQMIGHARTALQDLDTAARWVQGLTLAMPAAREAEARQVLENFVEHFNARFGSQQSERSDRVVQLNMQLFTLAQQAPARKART